MSARFSRLSAAYAAAALVLGGCSSALSLLPPAVPTGSELDAYAKSDFAPATFIGPTPRDTLIIGMAYVDQRCAAFFDAVEQMNRRTEVAATGLASATAQTAIIMSVAERSALEVARVAGALEITRAILNEYKEQFAFAPHSSELRSLVVQAMSAQGRDFLRIATLDTEFTQVDAVAAIKKYAQNCTLGAIREHWNRAVAKAVREGVKREGTAASTVIPGAGVLARGRASVPSILDVGRYVVK